MGAAIPISNIDNCVKHTIGKIQRIVHSWWKTGAATPTSNIDDFVQHNCREHYQEADHWADIGAQGKRNIDIWFLGWKLQRRWEERLRDRDQRVARETRVTISKIAVPLKVGAFMAAEVIGVCVLTSVLDLILCKSLSVQNINQRIHRILPC